MVFMLKVFVKNCHCTATCRAQKFQSSIGKISKQNLKTPNRNYTHV